MTSFADDEGPQRGDAVVRQLSSDLWQIQDHVGAAVTAIEYEDVREARAAARRVADVFGGVVWLRSDRPAILRRG